MTHEYSREEPDNEFNTFNQFDHEIVCEEVRRIFMTGGRVGSIVEQERYQQRELDTDMYDKLFYLGYHLMQVDDEENLQPDITRLQVYASGLAVALDTLDIICKSHDMDADLFRKSWRLNGTAKIIDISVPLFQDLTPQEKHNKVGDGIILEGQNILETLDPAYNQLIEEIADSYPEIMMESTLFKASYGYVLGNGVRAIQRIIYETQANQILGDTDFDSELATVLDCYQRREKDGIDEEIHQRIADELDTNLFYSEDETVESYIGKTLEDRLDKDERTVEIINALALAVYPNDLGNFSLDEKGEAFFMGANFAMVIVGKIAQTKNVDERAVMKIWRKFPIHMRLYDADIIPYVRNPEVDQQMTKVLINTEINPEYDILATKIGEKLGYDDDELIAFKNGLQYALETGAKAMKTHVNKQAKAQAKAEANQLDQEIEALFNEVDRDE